jgi:hypothetical protein
MSILDRIERIERLIEFLAGTEKPRTTTRPDERWTTT